MDVGRCSTPCGVTAVVHLQIGCHPSDSSTVLNALRRHCGSQAAACRAPGLCQLIQECSTPCGVTADITGLRVAVQSGDLPDVLNALRRHCGLHKTNEKHRILAALRRAQRLAASLNSSRSACSTPRGHRRSQCAQRLAASLRSAQGQYLDARTTGRACSTPCGVTANSTRVAVRATPRHTRPGVLNALRRHCIRHTQLDKAQLMQHPCSTPRGVTEFTSDRHPVLPGVGRVGAQRLAASLNSVITASRPRRDRGFAPCSAQRLAASLNSTLAKLQNEGECLPPTAGAQRLAASLNSVTRSTARTARAGTSGVLNALRRH